MLLGEIKNILGAEVLFGKEKMDINIENVGASDLMSDVLAFNKGETLLLTGLTNPQIIRTAEIVDIKAICLVHGKKPTDDCLKLAKEKEIPLLMTELSMYKACGKLYKAGIGI